MNVKYDTNGFADIVNEVKPDHDKFRDECFSHGCNNDLLGHIAKLNFTPYDEFLSDDEEEEELNKSHEERISNDLAFFIEKKCLGEEDNEVEPLTESDKNAFWMALNEKHGPRLFCEQLEMIHPCIGSDMKLKNLALLLRLFLTRVH